MGLWVPVCALGVSPDEVAVCSWFYQPCAVLSCPLQNLINQSVQSALSPLLGCLEFSCPAECPELSLLSVNPFTPHFPFPAAELVLGVLLVQG